MKKLPVALLASTLLLWQTTALAGRLVKRSYSDQSVHGYQTERTCWWNEVCKEEFQNLFRCKCPQFSYCRTLLQCVLFNDRHRLHMDAANMGLGALNAAIAGLLPTYI